MPDGEDKPIEIKPEAPAQIENAPAPQESQPQTTAVVEVEQTPENTPEQTPEQAAPQKETPTTHHRPHTPAPITHPSGPRDTLTLRVEKILEDGLNEPYQRLSPIARKEFKLKGEQVATKIRDLLKAAHVNAKKILKLILEWMKVLPGINRFFLEQEAKIKTDKILALKRA